MILFIVSFARLLLHVQPLQIFAMSKSPLISMCWMPRIFYKHTHKDALHDVYGCVLNHLPASVDILPCALRHIF